MQHRDEEREVRHWSIEDGPQGGRRSPRERNDSGAWPKSGGGRGGSYHRSRQNGVDRGEERRRCGFGVGKTSVEEDARSSDDHFCNRGCVERVGEREGGSIRRRTKRGEGGGGSDARHRGGSSPWSTCDTGRGAEEGFVGEAATWADLGVGPI
jgi:hypothetical protein